MILHQLYTEKKVRAYSVEELRALNAASTDEELQVWQLFLSTGFREDEVAHVCCTNIDFKAKTIDVQEKRQFNWEPKDEAERTTPLPDSLIELLAVRKSMHQGDWLIFANGDGNPQGHFLRILKKRALVADLIVGIAAAPSMARSSRVKIRPAVNVGSFSASGKLLRHSITRMGFGHGQCNSGWDIPI